MKRVILLLAFCCLVVLPLTACGDQKQDTTAAAVVAQKDLINNNFVLSAIDGKPYSSSAGEIPYLAFGADMQISGAVCNQFTGKGELTGATLMVKDMVSTEKPCEDQALNALDTTLSTMLTQGASTTFKDNKLTLSRDNRSLEFTLKSKTQ